jgi:aspartyl-tRNA(Asn)/glutamyl-tRNA(Gln) amidotransferase subunit C
VRWRNGPGRVVFPTALPGVDQQVFRDSGKENRICGEGEPVKVAAQDVAYVADLANLELTGEERARMLRDLNSILEYVERLSELDTEKIAPMAQVSDRYGEESRQGSDRFAYASRDDVKEGLRKSLPHDVAVKNAPDTDGTFFEVPKVIER